jgi:hypothetical protein
MPTAIRIRLDDVELAGELSDHAIARAVAEALPLEDGARRFGESVYLETEVDEDLDDDASDAVATGDIAYWPPALAVALFFGPTPESRPGSEEPVAASEVAVIGRFEGAERLRGRTFDRVRLERA